MLFRVPQLPKWNVKHSDQVHNDRERGAALAVEVLSEGLQFDPTFLGDCFALEHGVVGKLFCDYVFEPHSHTMH